MDDGPAIEELRKRANTTQTQRHRHELTPVPFADRRAMLARPVKNVQLNLKVTAQFKTRVAAAAVADRCSVTALIEAAVNEYLRGRQK